MRGVSDVDVHGGPRMPLEVQPSAWHAHPSIRKVIMSLWGLVVGCAVWAALVIITWNSAYRNSAPSTRPWESWSFFPIPTSMLIGWSFPLSGNVTIQWWTLSIAIVALVQGPLTLGLHCSELIASVIRDERYWRHATRRKGLRMKTTRLNFFFTHPLNLVLFVAKPILRESFALLCIDAHSDDLDWMFGLSLYLIEFLSPNGKTVSNIEMVIFAPQVRIYCPSAISAASSLSRTDREFMYSTTYTCMFFHCHGIVQTARPPTNGIRPSPDPHQPR